MIVRYVALVLLTLSMTRAAAGIGLMPGDVWLALRVQEITAPGLDVLVRATNWLGQGPVVLAISLALVLALFLARFRAEALLVLTASLARLLNSLIKALVNSPRPTIDQIAVTEDASGFGYPSGHAMGATLFYGALIIVIPAVVRRRWLAAALRALALLLILVTGFARVYSGAHWPSDVLGGFLFGLLILLPLAWLYHRYRWQLNLRRWSWPLSRTSAEQR